MNNIKELVEKSIKEIQEEKRRNNDNSMVDKKLCESIIYLIGLVEYDLEKLLSYTNEMGGFASLYPKDSLKLMKIFRTILEMEMGIVKESSVPDENNEQKLSHPWGEFLKVRINVIHWMREEQRYSDLEIAQALSMDELQVYLIRTHNQKSKE